MAHQGRGRRRVIGVAAVGGLTAAALMWCNGPKTYDVQRQPSSGTVIEIPRYEPIEMPSSGGCTPTVSRDFQAELEAFNRHIDPYFCSDKALSLLEDARAKGGDRDLGTRGTRALKWESYLSDPDFDAQAYLNGELEISPDNSSSPLPPIELYSKVLKQASTGALAEEEALPILEDYDQCWTYPCSSNYPLATDKTTFWGNTKEDYPSLEEMDLNILGFLHKDMSQADATSTFNEMLVSGDYDPLALLTEIRTLQTNPFAHDLLPRLKWLPLGLDDSENLGADLRAHLGVAMEYSQATDPHSPCAMDLGYPLGSVRRTTEAMDGGFTHIMELGEHVPDCVPDLVADLVTVGTYGHNSRAHQYARFLVDAVMDMRGEDLSHLLDPRNSFSDRNPLLTSPDYRMHTEGITIISAEDDDDAREHKLRSLFAGPLSPEQIDELVFLQSLGLGGCVGLLLDEAFDQDLGHPSLQGVQLEPPVPFF